MNGRDIKNYEGLYKIYPDGQIYSYYSNKFLSPNIIDGYKHVILTKDRKTKNYLVHRLVAETFIPNVDNLPCVNHKDENPLNNSVNNLEWCSWKYNNEYGTRLERVGKTQGHPVAMCNKQTKEIIQTFYSIGDAYRQTGISRGHISEVCSGIRKSAGGFFWKKI